MHSTRHFYSFCLSSKLTTSLFEIINVLQFLNKSVYRGPPPRPRHPSQTRIWLLTTITRSYHWNCYRIHELSYLKYPLGSVATDLRNKYTYIKLFYIVLYLRNQLLFSSLIQTYLCVHSNTQLWQYCNFCLNNLWTNNIKQMILRVFLENRRGRNKLNNARLSAEGKG